MVINRSVALPIVNSRKRKSEFCANRTILRLSSWSSAITAFPAVAALEPGSEQDHGKLYAENGVIRDVA